MTAVAHFYVQNGGIIISDILVSGFGSSSKTVNLPFVNLFHENILKGSGLYVSGVYQKTEIIRKRLCVSVAGNAASAIRFIDYINDQLSESPTFDELQNTISDYPKFLLDGVEYLISFVDIQLRYMWRGVFVEGDEFKCIYAGGGGGELFEQIKQVYRSAPEEKDWMTIGLTTIGSLLGREVFAGDNLRKGWGGGYELIFWNGEGFVKLENIAYWAIDIVRAGEGVVDIVIRDALYYQFYMGKSLVIFSDESEKKIINSISPIICDEDDALVWPDRFDPSYVIVLVRTDVDGEIKYMTSVNTYALENVGKHFSVEIVDGKTRVSWSSQFEEELMRTVPGYRRRDIYGEGWRGEHDPSPSGDGAV